MSWLMNQKKKFMDAMNERYDEKTGVPYVKGQKAHEGPIFGSDQKQHFQDDPDLK
jgi:hypothetical protein